MAEKKQTERTQAQNDAGAAASQPAAGKPVKKSHAKKAAPGAASGKAPAEAKAKPADAQTAARKPAAKKPAGKQTATKKPAKKKPATKQTASKKPAAKKPVKKPGAKKSPRKPGTAIPMVETAAPAQVAARRQTPPAEVAVQKKDVPIKVADDKQAAPAPSPSPAPSPAPAPRSKAPNLKTFLVTGASGFVGTHMVQLLVDRGYNVIAADLPGTDGGKYAPLGVPFIPVDIARKDSLASAFDHVDAVMHTAAIFDYSVSWQDLWRVNVKGTRNVCEAAAEQGVKKLVYFSSCDIYGDPAKMPADETTKIRPNHSYGESKFLGEREAFKVGQISAMDVAVLRPTHLYGPGSTYGAILLINLLVKGLLPGIPGDGKTLIHMVHVKDVVNAGLFLAESLESAGNEYNLSDDTPIQLERLLAQAAAILDFKLPRLHFPKFLVEAAVPFVKVLARITGASPLFNEDMLNIFYHDHVFDSSRLSALGYELLMPDVLDGFTETMEWYKSREVLKRNIAFKRIRLKELFE